MSPERAEYIAEHLLDLEEETDWRAARDEMAPRGGCVSVDDMRRHWSAERAAAMAEYDPRDFRWWNSGREDGDA